MSHHLNSSLYCCHSLVNKSSSPVKSLLVISVFNDAPRSEVSDFMSRYYSFNFKFNDDYLGVQGDRSCVSAIQATV
jgi:hypothetical protein